MRKIKFRGKRADNGEWVFGFYLNAEYEKKTYIIVFDGIESGETLFDSIEVLPETVGQFTGFFDKNGIEIYEGDILKGNKKELVVRFSEGCFTTDFGLLACTGSHREVIGNIHDKK